MLEILYRIERALREQAPVAVAELRRAVDALDRIATSLESLSESDGFRDEDGVWHDRKAEGVITDGEWNPVDK